MAWAITGYRIKKKGEQMKPLYKIENDEMIIRRGPIDILCFYLLVMIFTVILLMNVIISSFLDGPIDKIAGIFLIVLVLVVAIVPCKLTAKKYENTNVRITKDKIIFDDAGTTKEILISNIEKVTLDGKTKGISSCDLIMTFICLDGKKMKYSHLGDNTNLFLNQLIKRGICVYMHNDPLLVQNIIMDLIEEDDWEKKLHEAEKFWDEITKQQADKGLTYEIVREDKRHEAWCILKFPTKGELGIMLTRKYFCNIWESNYREFYEYSIKEELWKN